MYTEKEEHNPHLYIKLVVVYLRFICCFLYRPIYLSLSLSAWLYCLSVLIHIKKVVSPSLSLIPSFCMEDAFETLSTSSSSVQEEEASLSDSSSLSDSLLEEDMVSKSDADDADSEEEDPSSEATAGGSRPPAVSADNIAALRSAALALYNKGLYEEAMQIQYRLVRYVTRHSKATESQNGVYFLDYGLSQLRSIQSGAGGTVEEMLTSETKRAEADEEIEACFINLDVARVCFQKQLAELEEDGGTDDQRQTAIASSSSSQTQALGKRQIELTIAEVHNAIAQLLMERGDYGGSLREFESELLIYHCLEDEVDETRGSSQERKAASSSFIVPPGRMVASMYGAADCLLKDAKFEAAEVRLQETLDLIQRRYPPPIIDVELVEELNDWLLDARDMKGGVFKAMQESIQQQFAREELEPMMDRNHPDRSSEHGTVIQPSTHPFISALPDGSSAGAGPWSLPSGTNSSMGNRMCEHSSPSTSLFPSQSMGRGNDSNSFARTPQGDVHSAVVKKKPKRAAAAAAAVVGSGASQVGSDSGDVKRFKAE